MGVCDNWREREVGLDKMYRVQGTMRDNYYADEDQPRRTNLEAPRVTVNNKRMTNIQLPGGEVVQGIRANKDLGYDGAPESVYEPPLPLKPLRYNPGLKCDPALEAMRPERNPKHQTLSAGDRRLPGAGMVEQMPMVEGPPMEPMPYAEPYPTDLLSQIKMRNRRFQQSCAMEGMAPMRGPMGPPPPPMMMQPPQMTEEMMMMGGGGMQDELSLIEQDLTMPRRATRPFI